jgi:antitoxin MazE
MRAHLVRIGNSRGVRLPKPVIEQAGLTDVVELVVREGKIVISRSASRRAGWAEAASQMAARGDDKLLDAPTSTRFDREDWKW